MTTQAQIFLFAAIVFAAGWGWGQWWAERTIRQERADAERGRFIVSLLLKPEVAARTMRALSDLVEQSEIGEKK